MIGTVVINADLLPDIEHIYMSEKNKIHFKEIDDI